MNKREDLVSELNKATEKAAEIRNAETVDFDALSDATVAVDSLRSELSALDSMTPVAIQPAEVKAPAEARSFGERAAELLSGAPIGSSFEVDDRVMVGDPLSSGLSGAVDVTWADQKPGIRPAVDGYQPKFIDIVPVVPTNSDTVTYVKETGTTNNAAEREQGATTAESEIQFTKVTTPIINVAHFIGATEELLADQPALSALINQRAVYGVRQKVNELMLWDPDGAGGAYSGAYNSAIEGASIAFTVSSAGAEETFDNILQMKTIQQQGGLNPTHVVISPDTWRTLVNAKLTSGEYLGATPFSPAVQPVIWGLPVVIDNNLDMNCRAAVVDAGQLGHYVRAGATVASDRDLLTGVVKVRVQVRSQLATFHPAAVAVYKTTAT